MEKLWYLKKCNLFENLDDEEAQRLDRNGLVRRFRRGALIYAPTEESGSVFLLASGRVKIKDLTPDGKETILAFIEEGEIFGELAIVEDDTRQEYAEAVTDSEVLLLPRADMLWLMQRRSDVALSITKLIGFRRRRIENRLRNLLFLSSRDRLLRILVELVEDHGEWKADGCHIRLRLSHQEIAGLIGVTRETVTATLGQLQAEGLIRVQRRKIVVLDVDKLSEAGYGINSSPTHPPRNETAAQVRPARGL